MAVANVVLEFIRLCQSHHHEMIHQQVKKHSLISTWDSLPDVELVNIKGKSVSMEAVDHLLTEEAVRFVADLVRKFDDKVTEMFVNRKRRNLNFQSTNQLPDFPADARRIRSTEWKVWAVDGPVQKRFIDIGDVAPADTEHFVKALKSSASGIQVDFDDGNCPTWTNQLLGHFNIYNAVRNKLKGSPPISETPILMLRPRAWNMVERNMMVSGKQIPGPLFDFGLLMYHNAQILAKQGLGPFLYLSKLEGANEAKLWNEIFTWTEAKLNIKIGTIKACVLIENILAAFEMDEILHELKEHSLGLNAGIWDYSASFIAKFGENPDFIFPDRTCFSMDQHFIKSYMDLLIKTCHRRGTHATAGMSPAVYPAMSEYALRHRIENSVIGAKKKELDAGFDGFLLYDVQMVEPLLSLFDIAKIQLNQIQTMKRDDVIVTASDLLKMPTGHVTVNGLKHNVAVGILFIESWLKGKGTFVFKGAVEDSATAEISRSQIWQWIRHRVKLSDMNDRVTRELVQEVISDFLVGMLHKDNYSGNVAERERLVQAAVIFEELVTKREFPNFITSFLYEESTFTNTHDNAIMMGQQSHHYSALLKSHL